MEFKSTKKHTQMLTRITQGGSSGYVADYGGVDRPTAVLNNPGVNDFPEDDLHEVHLSVAQQITQSFHYGTRVKCLLVLLIPFVLTACFAPHPTTPAAAGTADELDNATDGMPRQLKRPGFLPVEGAVGSVLFWMALVLVPPVNILLIEYLEDLVVRHDSSLFGIAVNLVFEHAAELLFSFFALSYSRRSLCWVKPLLQGSILLNMLGVLGASILMAPLTDGTSVDLGISSWTAFSAGGLVFSTAVFLLPTVYSVTVVAPDAVDQVQRLHTPAKQVTEQQARNMLFISRSLALGVLLVYALYLWKVVRSNSNYYVASDNPNAPSSLTYALQYRERLRSTQEVDLGSRYTHRFAVTGAVLCLSVLIFLCYVLVATLTAATKKTLTAMPLPFTLVVLLPLVLEANGAAASVVMAQVGRPDIAAGIAFASIVHLYMFVLPAVVLVGWVVLQAPLELAFHPFLASCCFISALVAAQVMVASRVRWLEGGMLMALYILIVCICLLGRWHLCTGGFT
jgi:Ca2+:H+ antiporter